MTLSKLVISILSVPVELSLILLFHFIESLLQTHDLSFLFFRRRAFPPRIFPDNIFNVDFTVLFRFSPSFSLNLITQKEDISISADIPSSHFRIFNKFISLYQLWFSLYQLIRALLTYILFRLKQILQFFLTQLPHLISRHHYYLVSD